MSHKARTIELASAECLVIPFIPTLRLGLSLALDSKLPTFHHQKEPAKHVMQQINTNSIASHRK